jgi:hypothetical protein
MDYGGIGIHGGLVHLILILQADSPIENHFTELREVIF